MSKEEMELVFTRINKKLTRKIRLIRRETKRLKAGVAESAA